MNSLRLSSGGVAISKLLILILPIVAAATVCSAADPVQITIDGVQSVSTAKLEPILPVKSTEPELCFCVEGQQLFNFSWGNRDYVREPLTDFQLHTPLQVRSANSASGTTHDCDMILTFQVENAPNCYIDTVIATLPGDKSEIMRCQAKAFTSFTDWNVIIGGATRIGPIIYNAFRPGTPLYNKVVAQREKVIAERKASELAFTECVRRYQEMEVKPVLSEDARKFRVLAEDAFKHKDLSETARNYAQALRIEPCWPEGRFNLARLLGELKQYRAAIDQMKKYLLIVPNAPDARAAQDTIYLWEGALQRAQTQGGAP